MKYTFLLTIAFLNFTIISCNKDEPADDPMVEDDYMDQHDHGDGSHTSLEYHAHINSPSGGMKHLGETLAIKVSFESHAGETVHHIQVRIYEKDGGKEVYNKPDEPHIMATEGSYTFEDNVTLSTENGFAATTDYVLEAKVWGHENEDGLVSETVEFNIHM